MNFGELMSDPDATGPAPDPLTLTIDTAEIEKGSAESNRPVGGKREEGTSRIPPPCEANLPRISA